MLIFILATFFTLFVLPLTSHFSPLIGRVSAATSNTLNFQGRLLTNTGGLVSDGSYNIEFKIYDDALAGSNLWTENRTGGSAVTVRNGYFSVYLGDVTPFGASIPWDQELWMTMNVNADGEMTPRFKLTAVPYAFRAGAVTDAAGNAFTGDDLAQLAPTSVQTVNAAVAALRLNQTGSGAVLQLQGDGGDVFVVDKTGGAVLAGGLTLGTSASTTPGTIRWTGTDYEGFDGSQWLSLTSGSAPSAGTPVTATFYDSAGGATIASGVFSTINLGSTLTNSDVSKVSLAANEATVAEDGFYEISYQVTSRLNSGTRSGFNAKLQLDSGSGYIDVAGSEAYHYGRITSETQGTSSATVTLELSAGDKIRVQGRGTTQSFQTIANASSLTITKVVAAGGGGSGTSFEQNGNAFGSTAILGTTDTNGLDIIVDSNAALSIDATGDATFTGTLDVDALLSANNGLTVTSGNLNLSGGDIQNAGAITATSISGDGSGLTNLDGSAISIGTISDARLSSNVALLDTTQTYTARQNFSTGLTVGNTVDTTAGNVRWTGADLEVYDGTQWVSLTGGSAPTTGDFISQTITANSTAATGPYDAFESVNYPAFSSVTNASDGIVYTSADGRFTIANDGVYNIQTNLFLENSNTSLVNLIVQVNGATVFNQDTFVHNVVDPVERTITIIQDLNAGDYVEFLVQGTSGIVTVNGGSSATIVPVSAASGGGGGGLSFEQNGNAFGSLAIFGTTDANGLRIVTNGSTALDFTATGDATFTGTLDVDALLSANNGLTVTSGNLNLSGGDIQNAGAITATSISGDGSGLTNLDGSAISIGTISDARLSSNVALLNSAQSFSDVQTFNGGAVLGNFVSTTAGAIRWTGSDFEGYDGSQWISLTSPSSAPLLEGVLAFGKVAANGAPLNVDGASVARNSTGSYTVTFDTPATDANYTVLLSLSDNAAYNDINIVLSAQTTATFDVSIVTGDNGGGNDVAADREWHFTVLDSNAVAGGGGGGGGLSFEQNGNAFGATGILGTTDANGLRIISGSNTALEFDASGVGIFANGFSVTTGAVDLNTNGLIDVGAISGVTTLNASGAITASTVGNTINGLIVNSGSLSGVTGYSQASGNFDISGAGTFNTGTGAINLNGDVTAATTIDIGDGLSVAGTNTNVNSIGYFEANITVGTSVNNGNTFGPYTFSADNDADEAAWTFISTNGTNGLNPSGTNRAWSHDTNDTPSADVGPTSGQGGNPDGYIYIESSAPTAANDTFIVTNNTVFDASNQGLLVEFYWNQRGTDNLATLDVQTNENNAGWVTRGSYGGGDQATGGPSIWNFEQLNLDGIVSDPSTEVRFLVTLPAAGTIWNNDFALDTITITELEADVYGDNIIEAYNANSISDVDLLVLRSDVGSTGNVVFRVDSDGDIFSDGTNNISFGADIAENYKNSDGAQPGDVVYFTDNRTVAKTTNRYQKGLAGVVSTKAAIVLDAGVDGVPVGLKGRLPTKVSVANGVIEKGDYLTSGPDGVAIKATDTGTALGIAMEDANSDGLIDVFVGLTYYVADANYSIPVDGLEFPQKFNDIDVDSVATDGITRLTKQGELVNINGLTLLAGGIDNNYTGIKAVGDVLGAWKIEAQQLSLQSESSSDAVLEVTRNNQGVFKLFGDGSLGLRVTSERALSVQDENGLDLFSVNSDGGIVQVGGLNSDPSAVLFVLARKNSAGDPVGVNGAQYYNEYMQRFRCYQDDRWVDCVPAAVNEYVLASNLKDWKLPEEKTELPGNPRTWLDLRTTREYRILISVASEAPTNAECSLQYQIEGDSAWSDFDGSALIDNTETSKSEWLSLSDEVRSQEEVQLRVVCSGGDNETLVDLTAVRVQVR